MTTFRLSMTAFVLLISMSQARALPAPLLPTAPDFAIAQAEANRKNADFVQGSDMVVTQLLPDDTQGRPHQKFVVRLSTGDQIVAISNLDMCERVPVRVGDRVGLGGQFIWTKQGGIIHWLHHDPRGSRPNGFIAYGGRIYCQ